MRAAACVLLAGLGLGACSDPLPYDESANATADVARARAAAAETGQLLMLIFGANWCPDCRALDAAMQNPEIEALINSRFVLTKIDVGNWDKHLDVSDGWGNPIAGGIPALVVGTADGEMLYTTKAGELATSRHLDAGDFYLFFAHLAELSAPRPGGVEGVR